MSEPTSSHRIGRPEGVVLDGNVLRDRRTELGLSQGNVADMARLGVRTVRTAELGQPVSPDTARLIAQTLGLAYVEIIRPPPDTVKSRLLAAGLAALPPPETWIGVAGEARLTAALQTEGSFSICVEGPSGIGKSSLVRRVVAAQGDRWPDGIVWVAAARLDNAERLGRLRSDMAECLGFAARLPDPALVAPEAYEVAFRRHLWRWKRLVVLDDLENPDLVRSFADPELGSHVIVTTHTRWVAEELDAERILLEPWRDEQVRELLGSSLEGPRLDADPAGTASLLELVGGMPLHAHLAATSLRRTRHQTLGDYAARVKTALDGVQTFSGAPTAGGREPLVIHLLERLGGSLPQGALAALRDLAVFGDQPFAEPWAVAALGKPAADVRRLLDALADAWLVRTVGEGSEARIRLDERALAAWGQGLSSTAHDRLLDAGPALLDELMPEKRHNVAADALIQHLPAFRRMMDLAAHRAIGTAAPARSPDEVPPAKGSGQRAAVLAQMLVQAAGLLRLHPPREAGVWVTAALSLAHAAGAHDDGTLSWLLGWWWFLRGDDLGAASRWAKLASDEALARGTPDLAVSMALHAGMVERARGGMPAAASLFAEAFERSKHPEVAERLVLGARISQAAALVFGEPGNPRWREAMELLEPIVPEGPIAEGDAGVLQGAALANLAVVRAVLGAEPIDPQRVAEGLLHVMNILNDRDGVSAIASAALVERLGGTWPAPVPKPNEVFASGERTDSEAFLTQILEMAAQFGAKSANRKVDGIEGTPVGHLYSWTITGFPLRSAPGTTFEMFMPLDPIRDLLAGEGRTHALRFVAAIRGPEHPAYKALLELGR